jgi:hypothetical protein
MITEDVEIVYRKGFEFPVPAPLVQQRKEELAGMHPEGICTKQAFFESAMPPDDPLHRLFEWDKENGWYQNNLTIAANVMRAVVIIRHSTDAPDVIEPLNINIRTSSGERGFTSTARVLSEPEHRAQKIIECRKQLLGALSRYEYLTEYGRKLAAIRRAICRLPEG